MYIYILSHQSGFIHNNKQTIKIGSTKYIEQRYSSYKTYYPIMPKLECYYKLENYNAYILDDEIKIYFNNYRVKDSGGIEFYYDNLTQSILEKYFNEKQIKYEKIININQMV